MRTLLNISILLSLLICWTYGKLYNEKKEYYHLLKNVMNRLERFEKDEILHRRNSEKDLSDSIYQQQQRQDKSRDYNSRILNMLQAEKLLKEKRNRIYHGDDLYKQNYNKNYIGEDDGYDENLVDENDNDNRDKSKESYTKTHDNPIVVTESIKMPDVSPQQQDTYLCYAHQLPSDDRYIVEFQPLAKMQIAHHMLLFGCNLPYKMNEAWKCREMAPICMGQQQIMYAWAKNAPSLVLPKDVAFHVGGDSGVNYLVLQVHYLHVSSFKNGNTDHSGLTFKMTSQVPQYFAGIYLLADGMTPIPPHRKVSHIDMGCDYSSANSLTPKIYPFRFRVHAHKLGVVITGYRVRNGVWTLIGRGDPQRPQAFNKVFNDLDIQNGDQVFGRCTYNSMNRSRVTHIGATHKDEMCNFYTMYFYKRPTSVEETNAAKSLPCSYIKNTGEWPKDSDTSLAEMERRNHISNAIKMRLNGTADSSQPHHFEGTLTILPNVSITQYNTPNANHGLLTRNHSLIDNSFVINQEEQEKLVLTFTDHHSISKSKKRNQKKNSDMKMIKEKEKKSHSRRSTKSKHKKLKKSKEKSLSDYVSRHIDKLSLSSTKDFEDGLLGNTKENGHHVSNLLDQNSSIKIGKHLKDKDWKHKEQKKLSPTCNFMENEHTACADFKLVNHSSKTSDLFNMKKTFQSKDKHKRKAKKIHENNSNVTVALSFSSYFPVSVNFTETYPLQKRSSRKHGSILKKSQKVVNQHKKVSTQYKYSTPFNFIEILNKSVSNVKSLLNLKKKDCVMTSIDPAMQKSFDISQFNRSYITANMTSMFPVENKTETNSSKKIYLMSSQSVIRSNHSVNQSQNGSNSVNSNSTKSSFKFANSTKVFKVDHLYKQPKLFENIASKIRGEHVILVTPNKMRGHPTCCETKDKAIYGFRKAYNKLMKLSGRMRKLI